jgi:hypothetical protein
MRWPVPQLDGSDARNTATGASSVLMMEPP